MHHYSHSAIYPFVTSQFINSQLNESLSMSKKPKSLKESFIENSNSIKKTREFLDETFDFIDQSNNTPNREKQFSPNLLLDYGLMNYDNGSNYLGFFNNGKKQGTGKLTFDDESFYKGEFENDEIEGYGELYDNLENLIYHGYWKNWKFNGKGSHYNNNKKTIDSCINYNDFSLYYQFWSFYEGNFLNNVKEGYGCLIFTNGEMYWGYFKDNFIDGHGYFYTNNGNIIQGIWKNNILMTLIS